MNTWTHERYGPIDPLPAHLQPKKVWKHFFDANERWGRLVDADIDACRTAAEDATGTSREGTPRVPKLTRRSRTLLLRDHEQHYGPAYWSEMQSADSVWTEQMDSAFRHHVLTPRSVFLAVELQRDDPGCVVTAFRPQSGSDSVNSDEAAFRRHAESYFRRRTGMNAFRAIIKEDLRSASSSEPKTPQDLWFLASAVGFARSCAKDAELRSILTAAEKVLARTPRKLFHELSSTIAWDESIDEVAEGLKDDRPEALEHALATSEEIIAVGLALGETERLNEYTDEVGLLLAWLPTEWNFLLTSATARLASLEPDEAENSLVRLWSAVEDAAVGTSLRDAPAETMPTPRYTDALVGTPVSQRWLTEIFKTSRQAIEEERAWAEEVLGSLEVSVPAPTMGDAARRYEVRSSVPNSDLHHRVFVVDADYPEGEEVTSYFDDEGAIWQLETGSALLVLIVSSAAIPGESLQAVLAYAQETENVFVTSHEVNPPM